VTIDAFYAASNGNLSLLARHFETKGWSPDAVANHIAGMKTVLDEGGVVLRAFDGDRLVGVASLRVRPVGDDPAILRLALLHISAGYRNRGIGKRLVSMVCGRARKLGATTLYISSIPTRNAVDAYQRMGATILAVPDPELFAQEPEDIHLILPISPVDGLPA
jgi:predicted N-acetyltransferase YhbS